MPASYQTANPAVAMTVEQLSWVHKQIQNAVGDDRPLPPFLCNLDEAIEIARLSVESASAWGKLRAVADTALRLLSEISFSEVSSGIVRITIHNSTCDVSVTQQLAAAINLWTIEKTAASKGLTGASLVDKNEALAREVMALKIKLVEAETRASSTPVDLKPALERLQKDVEAAYVLLDQVGARPGVLVERVRDLTDRLVKHSGLATSVDP